MRSVSATTALAGVSVPTFGFLPRASRHTLFVLMLSCLLLPAAALAQSKGVHARFGDTDENGQPTTPLAHALQQTNNKHRHDRGCADPLPSDTVKTKRNLAKACRTEYLENQTDTPTVGPNGKQLHSHATIYYDDPSQRGLTQWQPPRFGLERKNPQSIEDNSNPPDLGNAPNGVQVTDGAPGHGTAFPDGCASAGKSQGLPGGVLQPDGTCDLGRNIAAAVNNAAKNSNAPPGQTKKNSTAFDVDANGDCTTDPTHPNGGAISCGQEQRRQTINENVSISCKPPSTYDDASGMCVRPNQSATLGSTGDDLNDFSYGYHRTAMRSSALDSDSDAPTTYNAMMGFTFAPPEISWGYSVDEEVCVDLIFDDFCFTVFSASIGYDFELGVGLRLPVQVQMVATDPDTSQQINMPFVAVASERASVQPQITPVDFSQADYVNFCNDPQNAGMADGVIIADCNTFAFPEFLSKEVNSVVSSVPIDGQEFVAQTKIKAGIFVTVLEVPIVSLGVNAAADIPTLCTLFQIKENKGVGDLTNFLANLISGGGDVLGALKQQNLNCASFTTPFGSQTDALTGTLQPNVFPLPKTFSLDADCAKATVDGHVILVRGKPRPICTGLEVQSDGMSVGVGLELQITVGSGLITSNWSPSGDASGSGSRINFLGPPHGAIVNPTFPVTFDNFDNSTDTGTISLNNFTYYLDEINLALNAKLEFGGILSMIPDLISIQVYSLSIDGGDIGIPIPQHNGTGPIKVPIPVTNYALSISGSPATTDPRFRMDDKTLLIKPGTVGNFNIAGTNLGTAVDKISNFAAALPDAAGNIYHLPTGWTITPGASGLHAAALDGVPKHSPSSSVVTFGITPLRDPLTRPGTYPVILSADSIGARNENILLVQNQHSPMPDTDPRGQARVNAQDTIFVRVDKFFDPRIGINPTTSPAKPGAAPQTYVVTGQNFGNVSDTELLTTSFADFNVSSCTLTTMGQGPGCPFRAAITQIPVDLWTTFVTLATQLGPLDPLGTAQSSFTIAPPPNWAGMQDTTYDFTITSTSSQDGSVPPAHNSVTAHKTVLATKQSMTRYIGLELNELMLQIVTANSAGQNTGGTLPIVKEAQSLNARALTSILGGNLGGASTTLASEIRTMQAFLRAVAGPGIPASLVTDWTVRANAILADLALAQASGIGS